MPLVLDIFGVVLLQNGLNIPLLELCANWRKNGEKIYGASNMTAIHNKELWQQPGIREAFDEIYCSGILGVAKPDPVFYSTVTNKIGVMPEQILFFDDSGTNIEAAQRLGWEAYAFTDNRDLQTMADGFFIRHRRDKRDVDIETKVEELQINWSDESTNDDQPAS